jgi:hypothetical protein
MLTPDARAVNKLMDDSIPACISGKKASATEPPALVHQRAQGL